MEAYESVRTAPDRDLAHILVPCTRPQSLALIVVLFLVWSDRLDPQEQPIRRGINAAKKSARRRRSSRIRSSSLVRPLEIFRLYGMFERWIFGHR
jgi:hypothetical protein